MTLRFYFMHTFYTIAGEKHIRNIIQLKMISFIILLMYDLKSSSKRTLSKTVRKNHLKVASRVVALRMGIIALFPIVCLGITYFVL